MDGPSPRPNALDSRRKRTSFLISEEGPAQRVQSGARDPYRVASRLSVLSAHSHSFQSTKVEPKSLPHPGEDTACIIVISTDIVGEQHWVTACRN